MIYTVNYADTLYSICRQFGVDEESVIKCNQLLPPYSLPVGSSLLILIPKKRYSPDINDSIVSLSEKLDLSERELKIRNPDIYERLQNHKDITLAYRGESERAKLDIGGYVYPNINKKTLSEYLPFLSSITPFSYRIDPQGEISAESGDIFSSAVNIDRVLHISNLSEDRKYDPHIAEILMTDKSAQERFIDSLTRKVIQEGYMGADIDIEYIQPSHREKYAKLLMALKESLGNIDLTVSLPPKSDLSPPDPRSDGIDYRLISQIPDKLHIMAYGWGRRFGRPQAIAPCDFIRRTVEYTLKFVCPDKIILGIPNYGIDWSCSKKGDAKVISCSEAFSIASKNNISIEHFANSSSGFAYTDRSNTVHTVFFEDLLSLNEKLRIIRDYKINNIAIWNLMHSSLPMLMMIVNSA